MDDGLIELVKAIEVGWTLPELTVVTGGCLITGYPVPSANFVTATIDGRLAVDAGSADEATYYKRHPKYEQKVAEQAQKSAEHRATLEAMRPEVAAKYAALDHVAPATAPGTVLTMTHASTFIEGARIRLAVVRIPVQAVSAWWVCPMNVDPPPNAGGGGGFGIGIGALVPFDI